MILFSDFDHCLIAQGCIMDSVNFYPGQDLSYRNPGCYRRDMSGASCACL